MCIFVNMKVLLVYGLLIVICFLMKLNMRMLVFCGLLFVENYVCYFDRLRSSLFIDWELEIRG